MIMIKKMLQINEIFNIKDNKIQNNDEKCINIKLNINLCIKTRFYPSCITLRLTLNLCNYFKFD